MKVTQIRANHATVQGQTLKTKVEKNTDRLHHHPQRPVTQARRHEKNQRKSIKINHIKIPNQNMILNVTVDI